MKVYAHRGFSGQYPENTMLAFRKAVEAGCDGIELDVQLSKDLIPVIMHDEKIDRTSDGTGCICNMTYDELTKFNCSYPDQFGDKFGFEKIPSLEEYLAWMAAEAVHIVTNIELKNSVYYYGGMEERVIAMIRKYHLEDRIILSSFNNASILLCKQKEEKIACGFLVERYVDNAGVYVRECGVEYYHPGLQDLTEEHVKNCSRNGIGVNVWTVNEKEAIERVKAWGVHAVITDFPDRGREVEDSK
ncbi:MAG: glycerophosphodiester phosphodiesterase [Blautia sp.]